MKKGQNNENPSNFKFECPKLLQIFSSPFTRIVVPKVNDGLKLCFNFRRSA